MSAADVLPWLNLLLVPTVGLLLCIEGRITRLEVQTKHNTSRIQTLERRPGF